MTSQSPQLPNTYFPTMRVNLQKAVDELYVGGGALVTADGTADALTLTYDPAVLEYKAGLLLLFKASADNTGAVTVDVNTLGTKDIKNRDGDPLVASDIRNSQIYQLVYDGTDFILLYHLNVGTGANQIVQLDSEAKLPAVDGSQLTNLPEGIDTFTELTDTPANYIANNYLKTNSAGNALVNLASIPTTDLTGVANSVPARASTGSGKLSNISLYNSRLLGRGSSGNVTAISVGGGLSFSGSTLYSSTVSAYYTGTNPQNTNFPVGSYVGGYFGGGNTYLAGSMTLVLQQSSNSRQIANTGSGPSLTGTWRNRGRISDVFANLWQRTA